MRTLLPPARPRTSGDDDISDPNALRLLADLAEVRERMSRRALAPRTTQRMVAPALDGMPKPPS